MAPSTTCVASQLRQLIHYNIDNYLLKNALFYAERLVAYDHRNAESHFLLALCHFRLGDSASAYEFAKAAGSRGTNLGCAYIFAQACLDLGRHKDGITALEKSKALWGGKNSFGKHTSSSRQPLPDAAAILCLLGKLYNGYENPHKAISCFEEALKLNPFMWDAFTNLCETGTKINVPNIFKMNPEMEAALKVGASEPSESQSRDQPLHRNDPDRCRPGARPTTVVSDVADPFNNVPSRAFGGGLFGTLGISQRLNESNPSSTNLPAAGGGGIGSEAMETPTGPSASLDVAAVQNRRDPGLTSYTSEAPPAPVRKTRTIPGLGMDFSMDAPKMSRAVSSKRAQRQPEPIEESAATQALRTSNLVPPAPDRKRTVSGQAVPRQTSEDPGAPQRRSVRLFNQIRPTSTKSSSHVPNIGPAPGRELKKARPPISKIIRPSSSMSTVGRQVSGNRKPVEDTMDIDHNETQARSWIGTVTNKPSQRSVEQNMSRQEEAVRFLLELFKKFGSGYFALSRFSCSEALQIYSSLPRTQQETPWVLAQMGRAFYEQAAYGEAEKYYKRIRQVAPTRFEDMEIYSTILWHLKRETDLAFLAHELIDATWQSPQAWCALGNSWSLARDHESALRCFKRATQLSPKFAYAFTLQGHEHVANEEYDKALISYRSGMAADKRHYNAWYGVGRVYEKLGSYDKAINHFKTASNINPTNAVLICCIGTVLEKQKQPRQALSYFSKATELAPRSALTRFKKARTLMAINELQYALEELTILKNLAPDEAMIHFLLGQLYKKLKQRGEAVHHFTVALNLDPKASQQIKEAIELLEEDDEETSMMG
ncbi:related to nuclear protein bimA [Rhynchosporium graminicola]|uniref:Related to nuclear protein bimA n=1 Tax=Rhynchosporium graminicola TaxID=2792576 RepID=A0A1E1L9V3_9HELO|nr:related to nuclear protein bimA [Rhynchosporium commune]